VVATTSKELKMNLLAEGATVSPTGRLRKVIAGVLVAGVMIAGVTLQIDPATADTNACNGLSYLIVHSDAGGPHTRLRTELVAQSGVSVVDFFDAVGATPTVNQLSAYDVVIPVSDTAWADSAALGNNLADYLDEDGAVVALNFSSHDSVGAGIQGRYRVDGYAPFNYGSQAFGDATLGDHDASHFLMNGVNSLNAFYRESLTVATGATEIATWSDGLPLIASKGRVVGINFHPQEQAPDTWSGDFARVINNAGKWLSVDCPTTTTLGIAKSADKVRASGKVSPKHAGRRVTVTLSRKTGGKFKKVAAKKPRLSAASKYSTGFKRLDSGTCRIKVRFADHKGHTPAHLASSATKTFAC